ncbi:cation diffusion facilitator family transporter [Saccharospirillum mangrovi]|uniref:cation diffusion facilitator family transporter n=1 Tax=Saccharospirillum mangrovi TaxID=2161747 RepID=UPI000D35CB94|nr:cation diffusion facilitator family transporter [Saccharospirillum mangrovi]
MSESPLTETNTEVDRHRRIGVTNAWAVVVDSLAFVIKLGVGWLVASPALIADAMHSLSDLLADLPIILLARIARQRPDSDHPYGHARFETLGTVMLGALLLTVALGIGFETIQLLFSDSRPSPSGLGLATVVVAIALKEGYFQYAIRQARLARSALIEANAWHARSDSLSSVVVLIGLLATLAGFPALEIIAAFIVAVMIGWMGIRLAWQAIQQLVDQGVDDERQTALLEALAAIPGVRDVHLLRTRRMGPDLFVDAHLRVDSRISVSEGHQINEWALTRLKTQFDDIADVTLHIDHEPDPQDSQVRPLAPLRPTIESLLADYGVRDYDRLIIHYHQQRAQLELRFATDAQCLAARDLCQRLLNDVDWIADIVLTLSGERLSRSTH